MIKKLSFTIMFYATCCKINSQQVQTAHVNPSLRFTENSGQWDNNILFRAQLDGGALFMEPGSLVFNFYDKKKYRSMHHGGIANGACSNDRIDCHSYRVKFENCNDPSIEKMEPGEDYENYFLGDDISKWKGGVKNYHRVWYRNLYDGVDYEIISTTRGIKYNFHVKPGKNPAHIKLKYEGIVNMKLIEGALIYSLTVNTVVEQKPYAYQLINGQVKEIKCNYVLKNSIVTFDFPEGYQSGYDLVIDPVVAFAAQSGSTADNFGMTATWDSFGNFYSGGTCFDIGYPTTTGAYSINFNGPTGQGLTDVVITKYNPTGIALLFSTYFGGSGTEVVTSLITDHNNNLCFFGATGSANFPTTPGAFDNSFNGGLPLSFIFNGTNFTNGTDIYIAKFNATGTNLMASTFFGGSKNDGVNHVNAATFLPPPYQNILEYRTDSLQFNYGDQYRGEIQVDAANNIYIASSTRSTDFPTSANAFDNNLGGKQDAIIAKFNPSLSQLLYSTYLGGTNNDCGNAMIVGANQEIYITGGTCSADFPTTLGAYNTTYSGGTADGYIVRLNTMSGAMLQSTLLGTNRYDQSYCIQADRYNNILVYGQSLGNMPILFAPNAVTVFNVPGTHQFISRFDSNLSALNLSTVFGASTNSLDISPSAFSVDGCGSIYLSGWGGDIISGITSISGMPLMNPTQSTTDGFDFYLMALDSNACNQVYGSFFGGNQSKEHVDGGTSRIDKKGRFYQSVCAGCGGFDDFPVTPGAWPGTAGNPNHSSNCNNGVFKIDMQVLLMASNIGATYSGCAPLIVSLTNNYPGNSFNWYLGNNVTNSTTTNPVVTYTNPGTYTVSLVVYSLFSCNKKDSSAIIINVPPVAQPIIVTSSNSLICSGESVTLVASGANTYLWSNGPSGSSQIISPTITSVYSVTGTNLNFCSAYAAIIQSVTICEGISETKNIADKFKLYPNPNNGQFYLSGNDKNEKLFIDLFDVSGRQVMKVNFETENKLIDLSGKAKGIYLLKMYNYKDLLFSKKVMVE